MWDVSYLINKIKKDCMLVNPDEFSSYFSLGACMEGINLLTQHLYGITLENENIAPGESWVPDLYKLKGNYFATMLHLYYTFIVELYTYRLNMHFLLASYS